jgi:hypothetical protein
MERAFRREFASRRRLTLDLYHAVFISQHLARGQQARKTANQHGESHWQSSRHELALGREHSG